MKCVMIVNEDLPRGGIIANTTAALGISLASNESNLIGSNLLDGNGREHKGITNVPIPPILALTANEVKDLYDKLLDGDDKDLRVIGFNDVAQKSHHYEDYAIKLEKSSKDDIGYLGMCFMVRKKRSINIQEV